MITGTFPGKRKLFDSAILKQAIENIGIPVQVQWNSAKPPASIFGKPTNLNSTDFSTANHVSVFYNNVEVISTYALKVGMGKILIRDKLLNNEQVTQVRSALENVGIKLKISSPSKILAVLASGLHFALLAVILIGGLISGNILFFSIGGIGILTFALGFLRMKVGMAKVGMALLIIAFILTAPSSMLQFLMFQYVSVSNEENNPRRLNNASA